MNLTERTTLYAQLFDNISYTRVLLSEILTVSNDAEILKKIPAVTWSYTQNIGIGLGKICSESTNEPFRLMRFKELGSENINERILRLERDHLNLIKKVRKNRNKLFAHTDRDFHKMRFSRAEVDRLELKFGGEYSKLLAERKDNKRFSPTDIKNDADEIRSILEALDGIWQEAIESDPGVEH